MSAGRFALACSVALASSSVVLAAPGNGASADRAQGLIKSHAAAARLSSADRFKVRDVVVDPDGTEHVRFSRSYAGLPVIGGDLVVHSRRGQFKSVSVSQSKAASVPLKAIVSDEDAVVAAGAEFGPNFAGVPFVFQVIYARGPGVPRLAWEVRMDGGDGLGNPVAMSYIVDARNGHVLDRWSRLETIKPIAPANCIGNLPQAGKGHALYSGDVTLVTTRCGGDPYQLRDTSRGNASTTDMRNTTIGAGTLLVDADNVWGRGKGSNDPVATGVDAHYGVASTWDYFAQVHGRLGVDGEGTGTTARIHYGRNYVNAFWSEECYCVSFGDGDGRTWGPMANLDIAGHELSHGITSRTAGLIYSGESGALNEATSDIFGAMVELHANNALDRPDYTIGEEIFLQGGGKALRYMYRPSLDGASSDCWSSSVAARDVHYGSGVANHFFYLLAEGAKSPAGYPYSAATLVCNGNTGLAGIGHEMAEKIWYRALSIYFTSDTDYAAARVATVQAATDLYGDAVAASVGRAWSAVSVN